MICGRGGMADALDSGSSEGNFVEVRLLSTAPIFFTLKNYGSIVINAVVAERQTRQLEGLVEATLWRFKSSLPHHLSNDKAYEHCACRSFLSSMKE